MTLPLFDSYLVRWSLLPDGAPIETHGSHLLPVRQHGTPCMLKLAHNEEERFGGQLMAWWNGEGAARVLAREHQAVLLERATGTRSLADMARSGADDEASRILCEVAARLHAPRPASRSGLALPELIPLTAWFKELEDAAEAHGGLLPRCAEVARDLLAEPRDTVVLHGDLHHDNVLDFGTRGWLAIDPKRLTGDRAFDYANIFTNPDLSDPTRPVATRPGCFERRLEVVAEAAGLDRRYLLRWILAWCGLSAVWYLGDGDPAYTDFRIAELAAAELDRT